MKINTNIVSQQTQNLLRKSNLALETHMTRLSSGKRINSAADDAAGLAISSRMKSKISGMEIGIRNSNDGISAVQTGEAGLASIANILQRMRELAVQSVNGTNTTTDRSSLNAEYTQLIEEISHVATNTTFNGVSLINAVPGTPTEKILIQLSDVAGDVMTINLIDASPSKLNGGTGLVSDILTADSATTALNELEKSITEIADKRASFGASLNRLNFNIDNMNAMTTNLSAANSRIEDADMSKEVSEMTKAKILVQTGVAMLSQANENPQAITQLLQA